MIRLRLTFLKDQVKIHPGIFELLFAQPEMETGGFPGQNGLLQPDPRSRPGSVRIDRGGFIHDIIINPVFDKRGFIRTMIHPLVIRLVITEKLFAPLVIKIELTVAFRIGLETMIIQ